MRRARALPVPATSALLAGLVLAVLPASPAVAEEVVERPAGGVFGVEGNGWGHGRGMSQWGSQGAATLGRTAEEIVSTYYPGTTRTVLAPAPMRVLLQADTDGDLQVHAAAGLTVTNLASGVTEVLPAGPSRWRAYVSTAGLHLQSQTDGAWYPYALKGADVLAGPVRFSAPTFTRVALPGGTSRDYRGVVQAVKTGGIVAATVVVLDLEDYLLGVVPRESPASWRPAALQAQSIAARSYSANKRERVAGAGHWDICDTTQCQVFGGSRLHTSSGVTELEPASTTEAVRATSGVVRTYGGKSILAEFSSSNGGHSTTGGFPYLTARPDPWDGATPNSVHAWKASLPVADLERRFPAVGRLQRVRITARDGNGEWGGRVKTVVLEGVSSTGAPTSVSTTGAGVYGARSWPASIDGLKSSWWLLVAPTPAQAAVPPPSATADPTPPLRPLFKGTGPAGLRPGGVRR